MAARALVAIAMAAALLGTALGATYTVGAPAGSWDLRTNYTRWASAITFRAGDQLVFKYSPSAHDVVEVSKPDYDSCSASTPVASFRSGNDAVALPAAGARYFICGVPGHCDAGMKLAVRVEAATGGNTTASPPAAATSPARAPAAAPAARTPTMAPAARTPTMAPSSSAAAAGVGPVLGAAAAALVAFFY